MSTISGIGNDSIYIKYDKTDGIQYNINGSSWSPIIFPCTITRTSGSSQLSVIFTSDITITEITQYFIVGSDGLIFDGKNFIVYIHQIENFEGLFSNGNPDGSGTNAYNSINLTSIGIISTGGSTLSNDAGWLCKAGWTKGKNSTISSCYSTGNIDGNNSGGLLGKNSNATITNCYSTGEINGLNAGGILGSFCSSIISVSYSTGEINGDNAGGICGPTSSVITLSNCFSLGKIGVNTTNTGGLFGLFNGTPLTATNCYVLANTLGNNNNIYRNCFAESGPWNDLNSRIYLSGVPIYDPFLKNKIISQGSTWVQYEANKPYYIISNIQYDADMNPTKSFLIYQPNPIISGYKGIGTKINLEPYDYVPYSNDMQNLTINLNAIENKKKYFLLNNFSLKNSIEIKLINVSCDNCVNIKYYANNKEKHVDIEPLGNITLYWYPKSKSWIKLD